MPNSIPRKQTWPSHRHPKVMWGQKTQQKGWKPEGDPLFKTHSRVHTPVPNSELPSLLSDRTPALWASPPPRSLCPAPVAPILPLRPLSPATLSPASQPHLSPSRPFRRPPPTSSHPPSRPHLNGAGGLGDGPPPQPGCGSGGGGWLYLCLGVGAKGATGFGDVLAPADGGVVGVGSWTHSGRNGGGPYPQHPPSLPAGSLRAGATAAAISPTPPSAAGFRGWPGSGGP